MMLFATLCLIFATIFPLTLQLQSQGKTLSPHKQESFVKTSGTSLQLGSQPFYYGGTNHYSLIVEDQVDVENFFKDCARLKISVVRTWLFCDGTDCGKGLPMLSLAGRSFWMAEKDASTGDITVNLDVNTGLGRFDYVLNQAKAHGVKLIVVLSNNWSDMGGIDFYVKSFGSEKQLHSEFFTNDAIKTKFKSYISTVLNHKNSMTGLALKEDPTIMAIELGNEYRCGGSNIGQKFPSDPACTTTTITKFIEEISGYIKMVDTNHLVAVGDEGFFSRGPVYNGVYQNVYDGSSGNSFEDVAQISSVDILGFHLWFQQWNSTVFTDSMALERSLQFISDHAAIARKVNKPLYLGEYGASGSPRRLFFYPSIQERVEAEGLVGANSWQQASTMGGVGCKEDANVDMPMNYDYCGDSADAQKIIGDFAERMYSKSGGGGGGGVVGRRDQDHGSTTSAASRSTSWPWSSAFTVAFVVGILSII